MQHCNIKVGAMKTFHHGIGLNSEKFDFPRLLDFFRSLLMLIFW